VTGSGAASPPVFLAATERIVGAASFVLDGPEGHHAATVRRLRRGQRVDVTDGAGLLVRTEVRAAEPDTLELTVLERVREPTPQPAVVVVQALPKGDRGELAVELLTEIGVDQILPWAAARCVASWTGERGDKALRRWRSTAREAAKQARRSWFPTVPALASTDAVVARLAQADVRLVLHESAAASLAAVTVPATGTVVLVVGPEGGITAEELAAFGSVGAGAYRLGPTVLRSSTAGLAAVAALLPGTARWQPRPQPGAPGSAQVP
jgi:16S rRNA (uracil1498-N3)-methyltransferase